MGKNCLIELSDVASDKLSSIAQKLKNPRLAERVSAEDFKESFSKLEEKVGEERADEILNNVVNTAVIAVGQKRDRGVTAPPTENELIAMHNSREEMEDAWDKAMSKATSEGRKPTPDEVSEGLKDFVSSRRTENPSNEEVDLMWELIPEHEKEYLKTAGSLKRWGGHTDAYDTSEVPTEFPEGGSPPDMTIRGKKLLKVYMEQGGKDLYTGEDLNITKADMEHIVPAKLGGDGAEVGRNYGFIRSQLNASKSDRTMEEYLGSVSQQLGVERGTKINSSEDIPDKNRKAIQKELDKAEVKNAATAATKKIKPLTELDDSQMEDYKKVRSTLQSVKKEYKLLPNDVSTTTGLWPIPRGFRRGYWPETKLSSGEKASSMILNRMESTRKDPETYNKVTEFAKNVPDLLSQRLDQQFGPVAERTTKDKRIKKALTPILDDIMKGMP